MADPLRDSRGPIDVETLLLDSIPTVYKSVKSVTIVSAYSYESRGYYSLSRLLNRLPKAKVLLARFNSADYLTAGDQKSLAVQAERVRDLLQGLSVESTELQAIDTAPAEAYSHVIQAIDSDSEIVFDLTTFPRSFVMVFARRLLESDRRVLFAYTRSDRAVKPSPEEESISSVRVVPLDGFEGEVGLDRRTLLCFVLGFEAARMLPYMDAVEYDRILAVIGTPGFGKRAVDAEDEYYITNATRANAQIVNNSFTRQFTVNSIDPGLFSRQLNSVLQSTCSGEEAWNVVVAPMGTKAQALGLALYCIVHPQTQVLYSVPNRRAVIGIGAGETLVYRAVSDHSFKSQT